MLVRGTLPLPVSLSPTSVISEKKGGKSLGTNGEERAASGCYCHESQGKAQRGLHREDRTGEYLPWEYNAFSAH